MYSYYIPFFLSIPDVLPPYNVAKKKQEDNVSQDSSASPYKQSNTDDDQNEKLISF